MPDSCSTAPENFTLSAALVFGLALLLSVALTLAARWIAPHLGLVDKPGGRHQHGHPVARFGALPLWGAFTVAALVAQGLPVPRCDPYEVIRLAGLLLGGTFICIFGVLDDRFTFPPLPQYIAQLLAAAIGVACLIFIQKFHNPITGDLTELPYVVTVAISLFWLGLMMNTLNWLDGVDGLAAGVTFIAAGLLFIHMLRVEGQFQNPTAQYSVSLLPLALMGATLGFLLFNWYPASIFMGGGAYFLGYTIGSLGIIGGAKLATVLLVMGLPLLDVLWQIVRRVVEGRNPGLGDRGHIHFRLIDAHVSPRLIAGGYYLVCATFGAIALVIPTSQSQFKLLALFIMIGLTVIGFSVIARLSAANAASKDADEQPKVS
ncbi:MAG TPA: MraY family glycosyltransferase [Aggregatilineales bacterium]|nr:MraY family glycosyltransferase [Aggregatilineales bacterium]